MIEINWRPTNHELRTFGWLQCAVAGLAAAWSWWGAKSTGFAHVAWPVGWTALVGLGVASLLWKPLARTMYVGWSLAAFPIGWVMSHVILGAIYFLLLTPIAWLLRLLGHDRLHRRLDRQSGSYWLTRPSERPPRDYFRQF